MNDPTRGTLPYASELFGVYQPLIGWKSRIIGARYDRARSSLYRNVMNKLLVAKAAPISIHIPEDATGGAGVFFQKRDIQVGNLKVAQVALARHPAAAAQIDSGIARLLHQQLGGQPPKDWSKVVDPARMAALLQTVRDTVLDQAKLNKNTHVGDYVGSFVARSDKAGDTQAVLQAFFQREATVAGYLTFLGQHSPAMLNELFFKDPRVDLMNTIKLEDPLLNFANYAAVLSPIGIVHLYREYFFEFDSFLGPAVGHVWLSPGGTVELMEVNTRRTLTELSVETSTELTTRSESQVTTQDDLADAVKDANRSDTKFGFSNVASYSAPMFSDTATASFSLGSAKESSRETTRKHMRQQSEKLSSEIKRNFKTTFKTTTEVTDTSSKRYVLQNTTKELVNYELRRKMRKVGVQVQDIGTQLCWHTFVDDPGRDIGIARLVHIAQRADLHDLSQPQQPEMPPNIQDTGVAITIDFVADEGDDNTDEDYVYYPPWEQCVEADEDLDNATRIKANFPQEVACKQPLYTLDQVILDANGNNAVLSVPTKDSVEGSSKGTFTVRLEHANFNEQMSMVITATLVWRPSQQLHDKIMGQYDAQLAAYNAEARRRFKEAFYAAARERIKLASKILPRPAEDLREEERTVVYRSLISQLMSVGSHDNKHVVSELVRSMFDVDKMLYFVAPEWWVPRLHRSAQHLGDEEKPAATAGPPSASAMVQVQSSLLSHLAASTVLVNPAAAAHGTAIPSDATVDWGGAKEVGRDNYYITEESAPAKLGSSLGWLLELDGDNLRNAFLNSPWVKAVIPIRPGKEQDAMSWLMQAHVEGGDGLDAKYTPADDDPAELKAGVTVRQALDILIKRIREYATNSHAPIKPGPDPSDAEDPRNHFAGSMPTEAVFEHGFFPLKGGIKFDPGGTEQAIFSQWMEILPTDQVVALQVEYDPKTLQIKQP